jgi:hypothetical protein
MLVRSESIPTRRSEQVPLYHLSMFVVVPNRVLRLSESADGGALPPIEGERRIHRTPYALFVAPRQAVLGEKVPALRVYH